MSRSLSAAMITHFTSQSTAPLFLIDLDFSSGHVRAWTGYGDLTFDSNTYTGVGQLLNISPIQEAQGVVTSSVSLSYTPQAALLSAALGEDHRGRPGVIYFGAWANDALVADPVVYFRGFMEPMTIHDAGTTGRIDLNLINKLSRFSPKPIRVNNQAQQSRYSGDLGLEFVPSIQEKKFTWSDVR